MCIIGIRRKIYCTRTHSLGNHSTVCQRRHNWHWTLQHISLSQSWIVIAPNSVAKLPFFRISIPVHRASANHSVLFSADGCDHMCPFGDAGKICSWCFMQTWRTQGKVPQKHKTEWNHNVQKQKTFLKSMKKLSGIFRLWRHFLSNISFHFCDSEFFGFACFGDSPLENLCTTVSTFLRAIMNDLPGMILADCYHNT